MAESLEAVQWRNIRSAVKQLADFCFGTPDDVRWGTCHVALTTSLTAKDGVELVLEPLPIGGGAPTGLYVVQRSDEMYLAIDSHSGGYPWWSEHVGQAERFLADERAVSYINSLGNSEGRLNVYELTLSRPMSVDVFEELSNVDIKAKALAKLSVAERKALGV